MTAPTIRGYWDGSTLRPVTVRGYWNGTTVATTTLRSTASQPPPPPPPPPIPGVKYGDSSGLTPFVSHYNSTDVSSLHMNCAYYYDATSNPSWSVVSGFPASHDLWFQTKATTRAAYDALLASMPATRTGKVYLHYFNEPENNIEAGDFSVATWQSRCDNLFDAIGDSGKTYVIPSIEIMYNTLQLSNKGQYGATGARNIANYIRPGLRQIGWSHYALYQLDSGGHEIPKTNPKNSVDTIKAYMNTQPGVGFSTINGFPLADAKVNDAQSIQNRINWMLDTSSLLTAAGASHYLWYNKYLSGTGDYRIETDPAFLSAWTTRLQAVGQW